MLDDPSTGVVYFCLSNLTLYSLAFRIMDNPWASLLHILTIDKS